MQLRHDHVLWHRLLTEYYPLLSICSVLVLHHIHRIGVQDIGLLVETRVRLYQAGEEIVFLAHTNGFRHVATGLDNLRLVKSLCA